MAHIESQRNQPCLLHAQDNDGRRLQASPTTLETIEPNNEGRGKKKGAQTSGGWAHIPHLRQCLGKPNTGGT